MMRDAAKKLVVACALVSVTFAKASHECGDGLLGASTTPWEELQQLAASNRFYGTYHESRANMPEQQPEYIELAKRRQYDGDGRRVAASFDDRLSHFGLVDSQLRHAGEDAYGFLESIGTKMIPHGSQRAPNYTSVTNGQLLRGEGELDSGHFFDHLLGNEHCLREWQHLGDNIDDDVCLAGLFHSIYGTVGYQASQFPISRRDELRELIGERAEQLVYWTCAMDKATWFEMLLANKDLKHNEAPLHHFSGRTTALGKPVPGIWPQDGPFRLTGEERWTMTAQQYTDYCALQLSHLFRQANNGDLDTSFLRDRFHEAHRIMAERVGGAALQQFHDELSRYRRENASLLLEHDERGCAPVTAPTRLRGQPFVPGGNRDSMPLVVPEPTATFPLLLRARPDSNASIEDYAKEALAVIGSRLHEVGVVLIRGAPLSDANDFEAFLEAMGHRLFPYHLGTTTRSMVGALAAEASDLAAAMIVEPHQELAYRRKQHPSTINFFCARAGGAQDGGETLLADMRNVTQQLDAALLSGIQKLGLTYIRVLQNRTQDPEHAKLGWPRGKVTSPMLFGGNRPSWQDFLGDTREEAEQWLTANGYGFEWLQGDSLRMWQTVDEVMRPHPVTGEDIMFAQAHAHHNSYHSSHPAFLAATPYPSPSDLEQLPVHVTYGNGSPLSEEALAHVRALVYKNSVALTLEAGDVLVLDNLLTAHGRMPMRVSSSRVLLTSLGRDHPNAILMDNPKFLP